MSAESSYIRDFWEHDFYHTPRRFQLKMGILSQFIFYLRFLNVVIRGGRLAKKSKYTGIEWANSSFSVLTALEKAGVRVHIEGMDRFRVLEKPAVFISNHMSTLETIILPGIIQPIKSATFVIKQELMHYPYFKEILRARNPIIVGRSNPREDLMKVLREGTELLNSGTSIILFPQTTRSVVLDPGSFNSLGIKLAKRTGSAVVPVALVTDAWGNGKRLKDFGKIDPKKAVHFAFGDPLTINSQGAEEHNSVLAFIRQKLSEWDRPDCLPESSHV